MSKLRNDEKIIFTIEENIHSELVFKYCPHCRKEMVEKIIYGRARAVCPACHFIQFIDPKLVAVAFVVRDGQVLMVKRGVEPAKGSWCLPGGFMEADETPQEAAVRECKEETNFEIEVTKLVDVHHYRSKPKGSGVIIIYKGEITGGTAQPGDDAVEVGFFRPDGLPENIVFESVLKVLSVWREGKI